MVQFIIKFKKHIFRSIYLKEETETLNLKRLMMINPRNHIRKDMNNIPLAGAWDFFQLCVFVVVKRNWMEQNWKVKGKSHGKRVTKVNEKWTELFNSNGKDNHENENTEMTRNKDTKCTSDYLYSNIFKVIWSVRGQ